MRLTQLLQALRFVRKTESVCHSIMLPQNTRDWTWPDLLTELRSHGINIDYEQYPYSGQPGPRCGGAIIAYFSDHSPSRIARRFNLSDPDAAKMLSILKQLDKRCKHVC